MHWIDVFFFSVGGGIVIVTLAAESMNTNSTGVWYRESVFKYAGLEYVIFGFGWLLITAAFVHWMKLWIIFVI